MIKKIKHIKNLSVFQNFEWDKEVLDPSNGRPLRFSSFNIMYGRNYSGKTSLSRVVRVLETGELPPRCPDVQFSVEFLDGKSVSQDDRECDEIVRVYNEDFVRDNLQFLIDPTSSIVPFAVLGKQNKEIENDIAQLQDKLGNDEKGKESGYYKDLTEARKASETARSEFIRRKNDLDNKLSKKATDREIGIKYNHNRYGEINYNISKLKDEINVVSGSTYVVPDEDKLKQWEAALNEAPKSPLKISSSLTIGYDS